MTQRGVGCPAFLPGEAMPTPRVLMSKIRQALRLLADSGLSVRQVAAALGVSKSTVSEIAMPGQTTRSG